MSSVIKQSQNYVWSTKDVLGRGATSVVYQGLHRATGRQVAVKTLKTFISNKDQVREFEVLKKINHENIVKLIAIETEEGYTPAKDKIKSPVIITELCQGGSLSDLLDDPENINGLADSEYLLVLSHLYAGIKYLRDNDIVHRDLKPGNIMKFRNNDGTSVYKLIDFGAARELPEEKDFQSLYGTEEYLSPDIYEKAILGTPHDKAFRATVDLWSIGVILYQMATGDLPFRPFGGRRRNNKRTMHFITTQKGNGVISGVQNNPDGPIYFSKELPSNCLLSEGLKKIITPLIAGLLEPDNNKIWNFERFFDEVCSILSRKIVHIFYVNSPALLKLYLKPDEIQDQLQKDIYVSTNTQPDDQILIFKSAPFNAGDEPTTSEDCPLFLFSKNTHKVELPLLEKLPENVSFTRPIDVNEDARQARMACCHGYQVKRHIDKYAQYSTLMCMAATNICIYISNAFNKINQQAEHLLDKIRTLDRTVKIFDVSKRLSNYSSKSTSSEELEEISKTFRKDTCVTIFNLHERHTVKNCLKNEWNGTTKDLKVPDTQATKRSNILIEQLNDARLHLRYPRLCPLSQADQYTIEKKNVRLEMHRLFFLLDNEVFPQYKALVEKFENWYELAQGSFLKIEILDFYMKEFQVNLEEFEEKLDIENNKYNEHLKLNSNPTKTFKDVKKPEGALTKKLNNQIKTYYSKTASVNNIIQENTKIMNILQEYTSDLKRKEPDLEE